MPVRSLNSSVIKWPDAETVDLAVRKRSQGNDSGIADFCIQ